jgi:hypothetical protein
MAGFLTTVFTMELAVANSTLNTTPINDVPATNSQASTNVAYYPAFQVATTSTTIPLPTPAGTAAQTVYVKNLDGTNALTVTYTAVGFASTSIVLPPGAVFLYFNPESTTGGGISALSAQATSASINAEVFLGY